MNRREWLETLAAVPLAARGAPQSATVETKVVRLNLRHAWTTTMSSSEYRETLHLRYTRDGVTGLGEGAPIVRYTRTPAPPWRPSTPSATCSTPPIPGSSQS